MKNLLRCFVVASFLMAAANSFSADLRLIQAVKSVDVQAVRSLISQRVDVNATDVDSSTALHWAAQRNNPEIVDLLLAAGANAKAVTRYNVTPLALACMNGNEVIIERLLKAGADANGASEEGQTALMTAALNGRVSAIKALLAHGAEIDAK